MVEGQKKICVFVVTRLSLLKDTENLQNIIEDLFKNSHISLDITTFCICLLKRQSLHLLWHLM